MSNALKSHWLSYLFLLLAQLTVGVNIVGTKFLVSHFPILFLLMVRFSLAALLLFFLHYVKTSPKNFARLTQIDKTTWKFIVAQALTAGVLFNFMMVWGLNYTNANIAGIITSVLPAMIVIMSKIFLGQTITLKKWLCVGFATLGLLIINLENFTGLGGTHTLLGIFIILIGLIPEAGYYVLTKCHPIKLPVFLLSALMNGINAIILIPMTCIVVHFSLLHISPLQATILAAVSLSSALFYVFWYLGVANIDATIASLSTAIMPIGTIIIAWLWLNEKITGLQLIGMILVIASIIIAGTTRRKKLRH